MLAGWWWHNLLMPNALVWVYRDVATRDVRPCVGYCLYTVAGISHIGITHSMQGGRCQEPGGG